MLAEYSADFVKPGGYSFDNQAVIELWSLARDFLQKDPTFKVSLEDGHTVEATDPNKILDDTFVRNKVVRSVTISGRSDLSDADYREVDVTLSARLRVWVQMSGPRAQCISVRQQLEDAIETNALWYAKFYPRDEFVRFFLWFMGSGLIAAILAFLVSKSALGSSWGAVAFIGLSVFFWVALANSPSVLFPSIIFEIGKTKGRTNTLASRRKLVFVVILLGVLVSAAGSWIHSYLSGGSA